MGPVELLQSTQKAVLKPEIIEKQQELIEKQKKFLQYSTTITNMRTQIVQLVKQNEALEKDIQRFMQRQKHLENVKRLKIRELFISFTMKQDLGRTFVDERKKLEAKLNEIEEKLSPKLKEIEIIQNRLNSLKKEEEIVNRKVIKKKDEIEELNKKLESFSNGYIQAKTGLDRIGSREIERIKSKEKYLENIEGLKMKLENLSQNDDNENLDIQLKKKEEELNSAVRELEDEKNSLQVKNRELSLVLKTINIKLQNLQQHDQNIISNVKTINRQAFEIYQWIIKNRSLFQTPNEIFFIPLVVNIKNPIHAVYFESTVSKNYQFGFVTTSDRDRDLIQNQIKENNYQLTVLRVSNTSIRNDHRYSKEELKQFGLSSYLDEVINAPVQVMNALCDVSSIHFVLFSEKPNLKIEEIGAHLKNARTVFEPQLRHFIAPSRFSKEISIRSDPLNPQPRLFKGFDKDSFDQLKKEKEEITTTLFNLQESIKKIDNETHSYDIQLEEIRNQRRQFKQVIAERERIIRQKDRYESEVKKLSKEENLEDIKLKYKKDMKLYNDKRVNIIRQLKDELTELFNLDFSTDIFPIMKSKLRDEEIELSQSHSSLQEEKNATVASLNNVKHKVESLTSELKILKKEALEKKEEYMNTNNLDDNQMRDILNDLPSNLEEIRQNIIIEETSANEIMDNQNVVREYEKRKKDIEKLEKELNEHIMENCNVESIIKQIETEWATPLRECVNKLNTTFQQYTRDFGIAGEVSLQPNATDYSKWEIQIKVKFRDNEPLAVLSKNRQSGGERSVTTILYLLALQGINKSPFRVVDEINQGMDPINERKIFLQMLRSCQGRDVPQSFLITPKLLPDLVPRDANNISILFILNGPFVISSLEWMRYSKNKGLSEYDGSKSLIEAEESESDDE